MWLSIFNKGYHLVIVICWLLTLFSQPSSGLFFPLFSNFFNKFRNHPHFGAAASTAGPNNNINGGGVSVFSGGNSLSNSSSTLIRVPLYRSLHDRRVNILTTVVTNTLGETQIEVHQKNNVSTTAATEELLNGNSTSAKRLIIPTSTSITTSISAVGQSHPRVFGAFPELTFPATPNLSGMLGFVQALKDIKRNYQDQELVRKMEFHNQESGDLMTRALRSIIQKVINKYQKHTEMLKLKLLKRNERLQNFLQMPMVSSIMAQGGRSIDASPMPLPKNVGLPPPPRKPFPLNLLDTFLIR